MQESLADIQYLMWFSKDKFENEFLILSSSLF